MIEDCTETAIQIQEIGTKVLFMNTRFNQNNQSFERVSSLEEIYFKISLAKPY